MATTQSSTSSSKSKSSSRSAAAKRAAETRAKDAINLLKADHRKVEQLFKDFEKAKEDDGRKQQIAMQICNELKVHTRIEEEIFYPESREFLKDEDIVNEAIVEHQAAKDLIAQIEGMEPSDEMYDAKVTVLQEEIEHHVKEEEAPSEGMFSQARDTDVDLVALRDRMLARKEELLAQAENGGLPPAQMTAVQVQMA